MGREIRTVYSHESHTMLSSEFLEGYQVPQKTPEEGQRVQQPKCYEYNNQNEYSSQQCVENNNSNPDVQYQVNPAVKCNNFWLTINETYKQALSRGNIMHFLWTNPG